MKILLLWYHVSWAVLRGHVLTLINVMVSQYKHTTLTFSANCLTGKRNGVYEARTWKEHFYETKNQSMSQSVSQSVMFTQEN